MPSLTTLDIIVLLLVGGFGIFGAIRGFATEVIGLFSWAAAIVALKLFYTPVEARMAVWTGTDSGAAILAFALVFGGVFLIGKLIAGSLGARIRQSVLGPLDRALGFGFGALKGLIIATLGFLLFNLAYGTVYGGSSKAPEWLAKSRSHTLLVASSRAIVDFVETRRHPADKDKGNKSVAGNAAST